jgi:hypothetical protein
MTGTSRKGLLDRYTHKKGLGERGGDARFVS